MSAFTEFAADVEQPGVLRRVVEQVAVRNEIILVSGDGSSYASPTALNTVLQFRDLGHTNVLYVSDSAASCTALRRAVPSLACVWSSLINASKPAHGSVCVKKYWDKRFYFYNLRKHYLMRLTSELGLRSGCRESAAASERRLGSAAARHAGLLGSGRAGAVPGSCRFARQASTCCRRTRTWSGSPTPTRRSTRTH